MHGALMHVLQDTNMCEACLMVKTEDVDANVGDDET